MKKNLQALGATILIGSCLLLSACASYKSVPQIIFDLNENAPVKEMAGLPAIAVADSNVPPWLDSFEIFYRLSYANDRQLRPYTNSRWSTPPLQLFTQRLKSSIAAAGGQVLSATESANNVPLVLHIDGDDFTQIFDSPEHSSGKISLRVSLFDHRNLVAQKSFSHQVTASSNDAAGGAKALAEASDATIVDILQWLSALNLKK